MKVLGRAVVVAAIGVAGFLMATPSAGALPAPINHGESIGISAAPAPVHNGEWTDPGAETASNPWHG